MKAIVLLIFCQKLPESSKVISPINQSIGKPLQCYLPLLPCVYESHQNETHIGRWLKKRSFEFCLALYERPHKFYAIKEKPSRVAIARTSTHSLISPANSVKDSQVWLDSDTSGETL